MRMARMREVPHVLKSIGTMTFIKRVWFQIGDDSVFTWASALAYSWLFAVFPFLIFLLTLIPHLPEKVINEAYVQIPNALYAWLPENSAWMLWENIQRVLWEPPKGQ